VVKELDAHPEIWNAHSGRTKDPASPHRETDDIWVRFRAPEELKEPQHFGEPHLSVFYPAWDLLPSLKPIIRELIGFIRPVQLGGILITRIPPGKRVYEHHDRGGWHATFYSYKCFLPLKTNEMCVNWFEDVPTIMHEGAAYRIENQVMHAVINDGDSDRITLIVCMRNEL
jgi:hypothetical protein